MATAQSHHILIVEDEVTTRVTLAAYLQREGFVVTEAASGIAMQKALASNPQIDVVLLDIMLPDQDGLTLLRNLRAASDVGIIMVSGKSDDIDRIIGLEMGADDYITKPFNARELLARVKTLLRRLTMRAKQIPVPTTIKHFGDWSLDITTRRLQSSDQREIKLTKAEFDLLVVLTDNPGSIMSRDRLLDHVSRRDWAPYDRTIDVLVGRLRKKIEPDPADPQYIITQHGVGYTFAGRVS